MISLSKYQVRLHNLLAQISTKGVCSDEGKKLIKVFEREYERILSEINLTVVLPLKGIPEQKETYDEFNRYMEDVSKVVKIFCSHYSLQFEDEIQFAKDYGRLIAAVYGLCRLFCSKEARLTKLGVLKVA
ncbi:MAG: hypothetical protein HRU38_18105 [Saccharospirillaceae bacterium]|nr:hypothetical protein [Pseudomonadales bacterium]NRB80552.1 hypothetical protein [Saccharospirillaceae bacterium]